MHDAAAAIGVVQLQHARLGQHVGRAAIERMARIAFDLDRPAVETGDQQALGHAADLHGRGIADRVAGRAIFRTMGVGGQFLFRQADAARGGQSGQAQRGPHRLQEPPPRGVQGFVRAQCRLPLQPRAKFRRIGQLLQAPPIVRR